MTTTVSGLLVLRVFGASCLLATAYNPSSSIRRGTLLRNIVERGIANRDSGEEDPVRPLACVVHTGGMSEDDEQQLLNALRRVGFDCRSDHDNQQPCYRYQYSRATGMLKLLPTEAGQVNDSSSLVNFPNPPTWVPVVSGEENVLVSNGWSFLDIDDSEPLSSFDVDAANREGLYKPKWGVVEDDDVDTTLRISNIGFDLTPLSQAHVLEEVEAKATVENNSNAPEYAKSVLLEGGKDPRNAKLTSNGYSFQGSVRREDIQEGVFACVVGGLPLFSTDDLAVSTATSGWLSFSRPLSDDHVILVEPDADDADQRIEVLCRRSRCHLGHYFSEDGYCINASALLFFPRKTSNSDDKWGNTALLLAPPVSWRSWDMEEAEPFTRPLAWLQEMLLAQTPHMETVLLGAGCFWHIEYALRRMPGVMETQVGYAGGQTSHPTYSSVCQGDTDHAEVVRVTFDPRVCPPEQLLECYFALHDPTVVRAHGTRAAGTGQYRSCILVASDAMEQSANKVLEKCREQLGKVLCTEVVRLPSASCVTTGNDRPVGFWMAEDYHQRHDERRMQSRGEVPETSTLSFQEWVRDYGRRRESVLGSAETMAVQI